MRPGFERYLHELGAHSLLTREEEAELASRSRAGNRAAMDRLISANLRFVVSIAKRYRNRGVPLADLVNEGNVGLIRAAHRFDETRGVRFISYAVWWVRRAILQAIERERCGPGWAEGQRFVSLDDLVASDTATPLSEVVRDRGSEGPEERLLRHALRDELDASLTFLPPREERVLRLYYGLDEEPALTLQQVGARLGVTRERVRQIKDLGLARLRTSVRRRALESHRP